MGIDCDEDGFDTQRAGFVEELDCFGTVDVDVELEEEDLGRCPGLYDGC